MKIMLKLFITVIALLALSCHRNTPPAQGATEETLYSESVIEEYEEIHDSATVATAETISFTPLADNERFAYTMPLIFDSDGHVRGAMRLYAVRNNDIDDVSELFTWEEAIWQSIQFTSDLRKCFFAMRVLPPHRTQEPLLVSHFKRYLYVADGSTGEVRRLPVQVMPRFRVSKDGRFVSFINNWQLPYFEKNIFYSEWEQANIFLFDIETETMSQFIWRTNSRISGSWDVFRFDNVFRIYAIAEGGTYIAAAAELDLATMELTTLWDMTGLLGGHQIPYYDDLLDDVALQEWNPNIRLQR